VEVNRERDRRRRAEREARHAEAAARRADEDRRNAEVEAERTRRQIEVERANAARGREVRNRLRLEQRIEEERRTREAHRQRLEAEQLEELRRLEQRWACRPPPLLHQDRHDRWREPGDDVLEESIGNAWRREAARRALNNEGFRRVRVPEGVRRRESVRVRERVVYEEERRRSGRF